MKYVCVDYGQKRTGIAVTDCSGVMAFPRCTINMQGREKFVEDLSRLLEEEQPDAVVVGLPLYFDKSHSGTTRQVLNMLALLRKKCALPIYVMEETLSSFDAEEKLRLLGRKASKKSAVLDQAAAVSILENFLETAVMRRMTYEQYIGSK